MAGGAPRQEESPGRLQPELLTEEIGRDGGRRHQQQQEQEALKHFEQRQREDIEADVPPEHGIALPPNGVPFRKYSQVSQRPPA